MASCDIRSVLREKLMQKTFFGCNLLKKRSLQTGPDKGRRNSLDDDDDDDDEDDEERTITLSLPENPRPARLSCLVWRRKILRYSIEINSPPPSLPPSTYLSL
jgi:hypothetical protein